MATKFFSNCKSCKIIIGSKEKSICCDICSQWLHFKCSKISESLFLKHTLDSTLTWRCEHCTIDRCGKCRKVIGKKQSSICCDICNNWIHLRCTKIKKSEFLSIGYSDENWFCDDCMQEIMPFSQLDNNKLNKIFMKPRTKVVHKPSDLLINECRICEKTNNNKKDIVCTQCNHLIHRKCTELPINQIELHTIAHNYVCKRCNKENMPFFDTSISELFPSQHCEEIKTHHISKTQKSILNNINFELHYDTGHELDEEFHNINNF